MTDADGERGADTQAEGREDAPAFAAKYRDRSRISPQLEALIDELHKSTVYWLTAAYKANEPAVAALAQDELSAAALKRVMRELSRRWLRRFDDAAQKLAEYFATSVSQRSDATLKRILKDGGISVKWAPTHAQKDVMQAAVEENVALIRNLPQQYLLGVQRSVMRVSKLAET